MKPEIHKSYTIEHDTPSCIYYVKDAVGLVNARYSRLWASNLGRVFHKAALKMDVE